MTDQLFYGNFSLEETKVTMSLVIIYLVVSLFPSMFQVSSLLLYDFDLILNQQQYWRPFSAIFTVNHPDTLLLVLFLVYISRSYEFHQGPIAYLFQFLLCVVVSCMPFMAVGLINRGNSHFYNHFIVEYALALPNALAIATIVSQFGVMNWRGKVKGLPILQGYGYCVVVFLSLCHRFTAEAAICTAWGIVTGAIVTFITKGCCGRDKCGRCYKQKPAVRQVQ